MSQAYGPLAPPEIEIALRAISIDGYTVVATSGIVSSVAAMICNRALTVAVLVIYHHLTTLALEHEYMWGRKFSSVTLLFHLNRWTIFVWALINLAEEFAMFTTVTSCRNISWLGEVVNFVLFAVWAVFAAIRIYCLTGKNWWLSGISCLLNLAPIATDSFSAFDTYSFAIVIIPYVGATCVDSRHISLAFSNGLEILTRACMITSDVIVLAITITKTYSIQRDATQYRLKMPLATMLLRNGILYFCALLCLNLVNVLGITCNFFVYTSNFITPLSSIIISHFLMSLRQASDDLQKVEDDAWNLATRSGTGTASEPRSLRFASFVGNMGELLGHGSDHEDGEMRAMDHGAFDLQEASAPGDVVDLDVDVVVHPLDAV